jgi:hypothetical protein
MCGGVISLSGKLVERSNQGEIDEVGVEIYPDRAFFGLGQGNLLLPELALVFGKLRPSPSDWWSLTIHRRGTCGGKTVSYNSLMSEEIGVGRGFAVVRIIKREVRYE